MAEQGTIDHWIEGRLAHPGNDLVERDRRDNFDIQLPQISRVGIVKILDLHWHRPGRQRLPAVADQADATDLWANRLNRLQHPVHRPPAKLAVANVDHAILFGTEIQRLLPR